MTRILTADGPLRRNPPSFRGPFSFKSSGVRVVVSTGHRLISKSKTLRRDAIFYAVQII